MFFLFHCLKKTKLLLFSKMKTKTRNIQNLKHYFEEDARVEEKGEASLRNGEEEWLKYSSARMGRKEAVWIQVSAQCATRKRKITPVSGLCALLHFGRPPPPPIINFKLQRVQRVYFQPSKQYNSAKNVCRHPSKDTRNIRTFILPTSASRLE